MKWQGWITSCLLYSATNAFPQQEALIRSASKGCGQSHFYLGVTQYRGLQSGSRDRKYSIHLPIDYDANRAYPVVMGFHGSSSIGFFFEADSKMSEARFSGSKIMVYPTGADGNWAGPSYANATVGEDLQFIEDVLADVMGNFCVDERRVYATGISNGGGFVNTIACSSTGSKFAAFAPGSGSYYTDLNGPDNGCTPARSPIPILEIHGGNDKSVPYAGTQQGEGGAEPSIPDWLSSWAIRNACTGQKQEDSFDGDVHHLMWTCDGLQGVLQHWKIDSMGR
ncbi:hypothetical protein EJ05DRAFT_264925 [Pseudovirgaria hyperparasitica]|uniref:feruloyl esterase n=1 Tax=Pseudovirgaria hyperparasitica TaxID=470096 RepID=A0A6A6WFF7_9PEZI|nr:uncharacterized protein EJ05DRAFT_264925 [Pseudovirgaria hyperparasitica]KAF2761463.1 hypothetical protein EJ05DRAFT_264925 [Pseudovirgaria hyperparasitica]